jgi:hypothetical protein
MVSDAEKKLLLEYQRAKFAFDALPTVDDARTAYIATEEALKKITDPAIVELVRRMSQEWTYDVTPDSRGLNTERGDDIMLAEKELYELTFQFGDNIPHETDKIQ